MSHKTPLQGLVCLDLEPGPDISEHYPDATDSKPPTWLTLYDVESPDASVDVPAEYALSESEREGGSLRSRTYSLLGTVVDPKTSNEDIPGKYNEEHMALVAQIPERGRRYKLVQCQQIRGELDNGDFDRSAAIKNARSTKWALKSAIRREDRTLELHNVLGRLEEYADDHGEGRHWLSAHTVGLHPRRHYPNPRSVSRACARPAGRVGWSALSQRAGVMEQPGEAEATRCWVGLGAEDDEAVVGDADPKAMRTLLRLFLVLLRPSLSTRAVRTDLG
ncbi:hypothetical protein DFH06DRAFT_1339229 [Mycena polygramma]|nr:hypothetical protein DFH06DRAFT_1339229 [Mycena polygramma]